MAALRRLTGVQRLLGLPVRAVSSGQTTNSTVSPRVSPVSRPLEVAEWRPMEKGEEESHFVKGHYVVELSLERILKVIISKPYSVRYTTSTSVGDRMLLIFTNSNQIAATT